MRYQKQDINTKGAYLHMVADTLVSVGVVVSGILISRTGWTFVDPVIGLIIALVILVSTWKLLSESLRMSVDAVPESIDPDDVLEHMNGVEGVREVHHLHIWPISTTETALTAHVVLCEGADSTATVAALKHELKHIGIRHATLETEREGIPCPDAHCE